MSDYASVSDDAPAADFPPALRNIPIESEYGVEDTRQAVAEARRQGVKVFCLTVDREAPRYAVRIFGHAGLSLLHKAEQLPAVVVEVVRHLIRV